MRRGRPRRLGDFRSKDAVWDHDYGHSMHPQLVLRNCHEISIFSLIKLWESNAICTYLAIKVCGFGSLLIGSLTEPSPCFCIRCNYVRCSLSFPPAKLAYRCVKPEPTAYSIPRRKQMAAETTSYKTHSSVTFLRQSPSLNAK